METRELKDVPGADGAHWYAAYTKHQHEKKSADLLAQKGIESYLPLYLSIRQWRDRKKKLALPLFPGYVFFRSTLNRRFDVLNTPGIFFIVESGGRACPIPDEDIESIRILTNSQAVIEPHVYLHSGDAVEIRRGPLMGVRGILTRVKNRHRVVICVDPLRKAVSVEIDLADVEKMPGSGARERRDRPFPGERTKGDGWAAGESPHRSGQVNLQ